MQPTLYRGPGFDPIVESRAVSETYKLPRVLGTRSNTWPNLKMTKKLFLLKDVQLNLTEPKITFMIRITATQP